MARGSNSCPRVEHHFDFSTLVHIAVGLRGLFERQFLGENTTRVNFVIDDLVNELGQPAANRSRATMQVNGRGEEHFTVDLLIMRDADEAREEAAR